MVKHFAAHDFSCALCASNSVTSTVRAANSGTFLGYRDKDGNEMHCAHAFCPHEVTGKCRSGCIDRVSQTDRASTIEECAKVADAAARRYSAGAVQPGDHLRHMTARWIAKDIRALTGQILNAGVCQKCGAPTNGEEALVDGQIWCHSCADSTVSHTDGLKS